MKDLAFIDTETTGLDPDLCPVWEIAVIVDDEEHCWQVDVGALAYRPKRSKAPQIPYLDEFADEVCHFLTRYEPGEALTVEQSVDRFAGLTKGRHLVGAVVSFDEERLRRMHKRICPDTDFFPWHYHIIDVEAMAVGWLNATSRVHRSSVLNTVHVPLGRPWKSDELSRAIGVEPPTDEERHSALGDARWAKRMYEAMT